MFSFTAFAAQLDELVRERDCGRLCERVLPVPVSCNVLDEITKAVDSECFKSVFEAYLTGGVSFIDTLASHRHNVLFEGLLDGDAVLSIVLAIYLLLHDNIALECQARMTVIDDNERALIFESTEFLTATTDPDPLQRLLTDFCRHTDASHVHELARVIYGRCEAYGSKTNVFHLCHNFFNECVLLTDPVDLATVPPVPADAEALDNVGPSGVEPPATVVGETVLGDLPLDPPEPACLTVVVEVSDPAEEATRFDQVAPAPVKTPAHVAAAAGTVDPPATTFMPRAKARSVSPTGRANGARRVCLTRDAGTSPLRFYAVAESPSTCFAELCGADAPPAVSSSAASPGDRGDGVVEGIANKKSSPSSSSSSEESSDSDDEQRSDTLEEADATSACTTASPPVLSEDELLRAALFKAYAATKLG